ncbi:MAG: Lon protease family protein [Gammaproteobacteria bacterium]
MTHAIKLAPESLRLKIDLDGAGLPAPPDNSEIILGQQRAQSALLFGVAMDTPGYNIYVMGEPGTGRLSMVKGHLAVISENQPAPPAYAYVENFQNAREPIAVELPAGRGKRFCAEIETLIDNLLATFPGAFESPSYQQKKSALERRFNQRYNAAIDMVEKRAQAAAIALYRDSESITFSPTRNGEPLDDDQFARLPQDERDEFHRQVEGLEEYLGDVLIELPQWRREMVDSIRRLNHETINLAIAPLFRELTRKFGDVPDVIAYLTEIRADLQKTIIEQLGSSQPVDSRDDSAKRQWLLEQYAPNVLVDYPEGSGSPVVYEPHPTYQNLFGRIEYVSDQGMLVTSFRHICPGSLHRANGGYLILDAEKLLTYPFVWEALKRALKSARIETETPYSELIVNTATLKPRVIPLNVKIILVGSREIYYLLQELDTEFNEMFRILADFDEHIERTPGAMAQFAALIEKKTQESALNPPDRDAIEVLIEYSSRMAEDRERLSARINDCLEIVREADLIRRQAGDPAVGKRHVEKALSLREERNGRISQEILDEMLDGVILIGTEGAAVGKVNGLTVLEIGDSRFGAPVRISATVYPGSRGIVDIERESELGQAIHSKGVMILTGYLGSCYAQQFPLAISASIAVEQSYGHIDGDSASLAEACALISALTRIPVKQTLAVTGSINQYGEVQAVGGVNEKIEGYFSLCRARGLNGEQGAVIPAANRRNLMLKQEVIDAVADGLFSIYAVTHIDQALELVTGLPAGEPDAQGNYPEDSVNHKAISRLKEIAEIAADNLGDAAGPGE